MAPSIPARAGKPRAAAAPGGPAGWAADAAAAPAAADPGPPRRSLPGGAPASAPATAGEAAATAPAELVLATRGSALALAQAGLVQAALSAAAGGATWRVLPLTTRGDRSAAAPAHGSDPADARALAALARTSPGLFTAEVAAAVRRGEADAAVHSLKDLPLEVPPDLCLAAILPRAAPGDVLLIAPRWFEPAAPLGLRPGATVGTSSPRRAALLRHYAPEARVTAVRGNVPTRLRRCREGDVAALLLARAGLQRLGAAVADLRLVALPPEHWAPAPGQGAVAVQARPAGVAAARLAAIDDAPTRTAVTLERALLQALGGGCGGACGAYAKAVGDRGWELRYGFAGTAAATGTTAPAGSGAPREYQAEAAGWRAFRLQDTAAGCLRAIAAWARSGPPPGSEQTGREARWSVADAP